MLPALLIVVIAIFPCGPLLNWAFYRLRSRHFSAMQWNSPILLSHAVPERAGIATRIREHNHPDVLMMRAAVPADSSSRLRNAGHRLSLSTY
ncbi:hypothetical protein IVB30_30885 [Bradyrhizobium sp. 200]|uniref:hypothetical protein n=1 Tax=Bradyrhizobium sp. 200 TaxID=2782665 RepID=UPI001FFE7E76|nr:hypothetical protein [Bradyrhizobium sp. 200]UPJ47641.1 hypothetical protein IVB30_30885 [Bradyrhizobium sp. 200]